MKCLKFNAKSTKAAQRAMAELSELGVRYIGGDSEPCCLVLWSDRTYCGISEHESEPSAFASTTEFYTKRKEFIAAVKHALGESK